MSDSDDFTQCEDIDVAHVPPLAAARPSRRSVARLTHVALVAAVLLAGCAEAPVRSGTAAAKPVATSARVVSAATFAATRAPTPTTAPTSAPTVAPPTLTEPTSPPVAALTPERKQQVFDEVWKLVRDNYLYADYNGVDWNAVRDEYAARIAASESDDVFYADLSDMVDHLNDHHSRFGPPATVVTEDAAISGREASVGIGVVVVPMTDGAFVQTVFPDSPAARADLRPRDRIIAVDGRPYQRADGDLQGPEGSSLRLNVVRPGEKPRDIVLERQEVQGHVAPYYRRFPGDVGYVWISTLWSPDMDEQVSGALTELVAAGRLSGVVLDLRANPGGWSHVLSGILSHFVRGQVGVFFDRRDHVRPLVVSAPAGPDLRNVPLVVLIDQNTASYSEVLAAILQREAHATVIGTPSAGNTETIYAYKLVDGSRLWLAQEGFRLQNGVNLEGHGVQPDVTVDVDWKRYSEDDDPQLLEALRVLGAGPK